MDDARPDNAFLALVRIPVFRRLWAAITISSLGDWLGLLATTAMAQQLTREESLAVQGAAISGVILTRLLPDLVLGPLAGALADRLDRRTTVVIGELLAMSLYLSIAVSYQLTWLYIAQFLVEAVGLFTNPAKQAMWVAIVPRERLAVANQVSLFSVYGAVPVAALVFALLSTATRVFSDGSGSEARTAIVVALVFNAATFGLSAMTVLLSRRLIPPTAVDRDGGQRNVFSLVVEGVAFLRGQPLMRALYVGVIGAFGAGGLTIGVAQLYVATLEAGTAGYGVVFGVVFTGLAIGMLVGPRILPTVPRRSVFSHAIGLAGLALLAMSLLRDFVLATGAAFLVGLFAGVSWIIGYTLIGFEVEDRLRGRVFAFVISSVRIVLLLAVAVGPGLAGLLGSHDIQFGDLVLTVTGPGLTLMIGGFLALGVSAYATRQVAPGRSRTRVRDVLRLLWGRSDLLSASASSVGLFVVVEGADRALTHRYAEDLAGVLRECGCPVLVTSEPSDTALGRQVRGVLFPPAPGSGTGFPPAEPATDDDGRPVGAHTAALLAAADRAQHVATVIRPALERNEVVVNTHYVDTSIAFHGAGQGLDGDRIFRTSLWVTRGLLPDLTVVVDAPVTAAPAGADPVAVRRAFLAQADAAPDRYVVVPGDLLEPDADGSLVSPVVRRRITTLLALRYPPASGAADPPVGATAPASPGPAEGSVG
ncbi:bifunctional MFS transporter/dTMP kinase [Geodermatophilus sabuli]|uniref:Thymidylate kinase n=1 Tax=Geodermatophilus sabuli TaxID=1564158 RepID=A0A285E8Y0_9ACTN|nr:MFS transporter [Geodermatophilus sabuli]MBB3085013.1 dTMP kinase [Geodermatophilus sabuli]SNX95579.1 thymidylate kinase [Geodermatophilus sabuli]